MSDSLGQFEITDNQGSSVPFTGTATPVPAAVPAVAGEIISGFIFVALQNNIEVSTDGGTNYYPLSRNEELSLNLKGDIRQLFVRTSGGNRNWKAILNFEDGE